MDCMVSLVSFASISYYCHIRIRLSSIIASYLAITIPVVSVVIIHSTDEQDYNRGGVSQATKKQINGLILSLVFMSHQNTYSAPVFR